VRGGEETGGGEEECGECGRGRERSVEDVGRGRGEECGGVGRGRGRSVEEWEDGGGERSVEDVESGRGRGVEEWEEGGGGVWRNGKREGEKCGGVGGGRGREEGK